MYLAINCNLSASIHHFIFCLVTLDMYFYLVNKDIIIIIIIIIIIVVVVVVVVITSRTDDQGKKYCEKRF